MMDKKCWTPIACELRAKCALPDVDFRHGYFQPQHVGTSCHAFKAKPVEYDFHEQIALRMGAHD